MLWSGQSWRPRDDADDPVPLPPEETGKTGMLVLVPPAVMHALDEARERAG
jgi:hypothetical protein